MLFCDYSDKNTRIAQHEAKTLLVHANGSDQPATVPTSQPMKQRLHQGVLLHWLCCYGILACNCFSATFFHPAMITLHRYWRAKVSDHFYTTNSNGIGTDVVGEIGKYGYKYEGIQCYIYQEQIPDAVPLYRYWKGSVSDHFYTTNADEIGTTERGQVGKYNYKSECIAGYCFPTQEEESIPLYRYWNPRNSDHFYTTNGKEIGTVTPGEKGAHGYVSEGIVCYVPPA